MDEIIGYPSDNPIERNEKGFDPYEYDDILYEIEKDREMFEDGI